MPIDDPQGFDDGVTNALDRLETSDDVHDADREQLQQWIRQKDGNVKPSSLKTYCRRVRVGSERADRPLVELDEDGYQQFVFSLRHDHDLADSTIKSYEDAILQFLADRTDAEWPDEVERTSVESDGPSIDEILTPADIQSLTRAARHERDVAFIEFLADTGARLSLALSLRVGDVSLGQTSTYAPNDEALGLKGAEITEYPLIDSAAPIKSYLRSAHPRPDDERAALFHKLKPHTREGEDRWRDRGSVNPNAMRQQLYRIRDRTDIDKPTNPHAFRHAAITRMVREGYSRSQIEHRVHWTLDTDMWATYEHITSAEHNEDIFREAGIVDDDSGPDTVRKECGTCRHPLAPHHEFCPNCGDPATPGAADTVDEAADTIIETLTETQNPSARRELEQLLRDVLDRGDLAQDDHDDPS